jgi:hypothetical protein
MSSARCGWSLSSCSSLTSSPFSGVPICTYLETAHLLRSAPTPDSGSYPDAPAPEATLATQSNQWPLHPNSQKSLLSYVLVNYYIYELFQDICRPFPTLALKISFQHLIEVITFAQRRSLPSNTSICRQFHLEMAISDRVET